MNRIETQDLYCGAYILNGGGILEKTKVYNGRNGKPSITFVFTGSDVEKLFKEFLSGQALTNAASFKAAMIHLKDVMFERLREEERRDDGNAGKP
jgi:hypothetical protein